MGATLDETRVELEAQRARVRGTAEDLGAATRRSLDIKAILGRNPVRTVGLAAGAVFFLLGGPHKTVRAIRGALGANADGERAYAALPASLQAFVDHSAPGFGDGKTEAKAQLALALHAWREDPKNRKKADQLVRETLTPPGPSRAFWALVEVAAVTAAGIIAKQVVARRMAGGLLGPLVPARRSSEERIEEAVELAAAKATKGNEKKPKGASTTGWTGYSGWSGRQPTSTTSTAKAGSAKPGDSKAASKS